MQSGKATFAFGVVDERPKDFLLCRIVTQGDIQQLLIIDDPRAAETYCQDYIPDCDAPLPYNNILTQAEEVKH